MKYLYVIVAILWINMAKAQNYPNIVNYNFNGTPTNGVKIKTNLPFTLSSQMPTISIKGYNYNTAKVIDLTLVYYIYYSGDPGNINNLYFHNPSISSSGGYVPKVFLANENGKVIIYIDDRAYYQRFTVSAFAQGIAEQSSWFQDWSVADEALTGANTIEVPYKNNFKGDVYFSDNGIWNTSGNVGVGTTNPAAKISFNNVNDGTNGADGITWFNETPLSYGIYRTPGPWIEPAYQQLKLNWDTGIVLEPGSAHQNSFVDIRGGGLRVTSGNVGIGTIAPTSKLNIAVGAGAANGTVGLKIGSIDNYPSLELGVENNYDAQIRTYGNDLKIYAGHFRNIGNVSTEDHKINFYTSKTGSANWSIPKMVLTADGQLGVGTNSPTDMLTVAGKIGAREIKVSTNAGADFVFEPDYQLLDLTELEEFVKTNKHLPEIPTAKEMVENGVNLGELNIKLLQKVEELTLYLIEKDKKNDALIKRVEALENQKGKSRKQKASSGH